MGAHCSIHNDTVDETVMVFVGANTKVLQPLLWSITGVATAVSGGVAMGSLPAVVRVGGQALLSVNALTTAAGGVVSASHFVLDHLQTKLVSDLTKGGYHKCLPGQTYTTPPVTPGLNMRAWLVRIQKTDRHLLIQRCDASVWSGHDYRVMDKRQFRHWKSQETIPLVAIKQPTSHNVLEEDEDYTLLESDMLPCHCKIVEQGTNDWNDDEAWIQVDTVTTTLPDAP
jgi:hypothetical protein